MTEREKTKMFTTFVVIDIHNKLSLLVIRVHGYDKNQVPCRCGR